uniref:GED domain-containing protein n=1 Tax=Chenopodium quinoa TaxID=63459 RepID=A0A803MDV8_CHEQI
MGPRNKLFVPEVPFEVLIRRQIERLLDPSLQCLQFACDELMKMSHSCESRELRRFPGLKKRMDAVMLDFVCNSMKPVEKRIVDTIFMEADDINTSHPNFIGGQRAIEVAKQRIRASRGIVDLEQLASPDRSSRNSQKYQSVVVERSGSAGGQTSQKKVFTHANNNSMPDPSATFWGMPFKFWNQSSSGTPVGNDRYKSDIAFQTPSSIQLVEPLASIRPTEDPTEDELTEVLITRMLLKSYFDIVRKKVEDDVPKAIMHFLVNRIKRDLHSTFIQAIYRYFTFILIRRAGWMNSNKFVGQ